MGSFLAAALFVAAFGVALAIIVLTILPYAGRIHSLLTRGVQYRSMPLPAPRARMAGRAMPQVMAVPARLRAAA